MLESGKAMEFLEFLVLRCDARLLPELNQRALGTRCTVCVHFEIRHLGFWPRRILLAACIRGWKRNHWTFMIHDSCLVLPQ